MSMNDFSHCGMFERNTLLILFHLFSLTSSFGRRQNSNVVTVCGVVVVVLSLKVCNLFLGLPYLTLVRDKSLFKYLVYHNWIGSS